MKYLEHTFESPHHNLACDEALLEQCDNGSPDEVLRFWESKHYFIVTGLSGKIHEEVYLNECRKRNIPVLRRSSGGGTVLQGPGCLNYALILRINGKRPLGTITETNRHIIEQHQRTLNAFLKNQVRIQGFTDLTLHQLKFSGNAQRRKKNALLFHGTFLIHANFKLMNQLLPTPKRQPAYRANRMHDEFLTNLPLQRKIIKEALMNTWDASELLAELPIKAIEALVSQKYIADHWNYKF